MYEIRAALDQRIYREKDGTYRDLNSADFQLVSGFIKDEFVKYGKWPHLIGSRNLYHRVTMGPYISALESIAYTHPQLMCLTSNSYTTANRLVHLVGPAQYILETDHTAWDAHMHKSFLEILNAFYRRVLVVAPGDEESFADCLDAYLETNWKYRSGMSYTLTGTRVSGDVDTSFGNSIIHAAVNRVVARLCNLQIDQVVKGDDSVIAILGVASGPPRHVLRDEFCLGMYELFGFDVKPIWRTTLSEVEFCSSMVHPILSADGIPTWKMYRKPSKILVNTPWALGCLSVRLRQKRAREKSLCEYLSNQGCPVLAAVTRFWWISAGCPNYSSADKDLQRSLRYYDAHGAKISDLSRIDFERKYGIAPSDQILCEQYIDQAWPGSNLDHWVLKQLANA